MEQGNMNGSHNISAVSAGTVKTPFYADAFTPKACHENGVALAEDDQNKGSGGNRNSPARRVDKGFETFMMTGDMIIRTSPHHKNDSPEKRLKIAADGDGVENAGVVAPPSPKRSSKIPKPVGGSPKSIPRTPPRTLPKSHIGVPATDVAKEDNAAKTEANSSPSVLCSDQNVDETRASEAQAEPVVVTPVVQQVSVTNAPSEHVQLLTRVPVAEICSPVVETMTMVVKEMSPVPSTQTTQDVEMVPAEHPKCVMPLENVGILGVPRYPDVPVALDIPPDDISSEDEKYRHEDIVNVDELPPPPDELLQELGVAAAPPRREFTADDHVFIHQNSAPPAEMMHNAAGTKSHPGSISVKRNSSDSEADRMRDGAGSSVDHSLVSSKSAEKLVHCTRTNPSPIGGVRNSKSHENYLESNMNGGLTLVSIAFDDSLASSVDVLHYEQSSAGSEDSLQREDAMRAGQSRSLDSSPEKKCECVTGDKMHTFIMLDEPTGAVKKQRSMPDGVQGEHAPTEGHTNGTTEPARQQGASLPMVDTQQASNVIHTDQRTDFDLEKQNTNYSNSSRACTSPRAASEPSGAITEGRSDAELARHDEAVAKSYEVAAASSPRRSPCSSSPSDGAGGPLSEIPVNSTVSADATDSGDWDVHSMYHQPVKEVDRPSAARLAKRLYNLEGFQRVDVARHLSKRNDFAYLVGNEYLKYFDLKELSLDAALRCFLKRLTLTGETQECERILAHFSNHYVHCNAGMFNSEDACHTLTCALMLLNTDLHTQSTGRRMTLSEFIDNLADLNDGENFPKEVLKNLYHAIKTEPLQFDLCSDDTLEAGTNLGATNAAAAAQSNSADTPRHAGHNPFLEVPDPSKATEYKKGYVMRKCCVNPDGRHTPMGKRGWKMFYATLRDTVLYLHKDEHGFKRSALCDHMGNAIRVHHALATKATDYKKKQHVFRLKTADWAQYLFQTSDSRECQEWIDTINFVAAMLSAPPLPSAIGSQKKFQRPLLPSSYTKLNMREQLLHHENMATQLEQELKEHRRNAPDKGSKSRTIQQYCEKESYLQYELKRFKMYSFLMQARMTTYPELEPSLVEIAIGEVDEPPASPPADSHMTPPLYPGATTVTVSPRSRDSRVVQRSQSDRTVNLRPRDKVTLVHQNAFDYGTAV